MIYICISRGEGVSCRRTIEMMTSSSLTNNCTHRHDYNIVVCTSSVPYLLNGILAPEKDSYTSPVRPSIITPDHPPEAGAQSTGSDMGRSFHALHRTDPFSSSIVSVKFLMAPSYGIPLANPYPLLVNTHIQ